MLASQGQKVSVNTGHSNRVCDPERVADLHGQVTNLPAESIRHHIIVTTNRSLSGFISSPECRSAVDRLYKHLSQTPRMLFTSHSSLTLRSMKWVREAGTGVTAPSAPLRPFYQPQFVLCSLCSGIIKYEMRSWFINGCGEVCWKCFSPLCRARWYVWSALFHSFRGGFVNNVCPSALSVYLLTWRSVSCIFIAVLMCTDVVFYTLTQNHPWSKFPPFNSSAQNQKWSIYIFAFSWSFQQPWFSFFCSTCDENDQADRWTRLLVFLPDTCDHVRNTTSTCVSGFTRALCCAACWDSGSGSLTSGPGTWTSPTSWSLEGSQGEYRWKI